ncbi:MAG: hypothetical protein LBH51_04145 [Treponema sp.]|jgi:hypothetical protein|nr:hypothetical protein [Treponema sp.]
MRTIILGVLIALAPLAFLSADGGDRNNRNGKSAGGERDFVLDAGFTWASNPRLIGGHFDMGFVLHKKVLYLQNNILLRAGGLSFNNGDYSIFTVSDKLIIGRNSRDMMYTYLEGGFGIYGNDTKPFFEDPFAVSFGFGGGWDIGMDDFGGLYVELGYLGQMAGSKYPVSGVIIQTGWKLFF